jgi:hypothetical protein
MMGARECYDVSLVFKSALNWVCPQLPQARAAEPGRLAAQPPELLLPAAAAASLDLLPHRS